MPWYSGLEDIVKTGVPLAQLTSFRLGGPARWLVCPRTHAELAEVIHRCRQEQVPWRIIGRGANILPHDEGFDGAVIRLIAREFTSLDLHERPDEVLLTVGGGADLGATILASVRSGLAGLEGLAGIPSTVGGAVRMNAGGRFGEIAGAVSRVLVLQPDGRIQWIDKARAGFGYRTSALEGCAVLAVEFALEPDEPKALADRYRQTWIYKQQRQPLARRTAGCIFKNPPGRSAGRLLDRAGCKNMRSGGAIVSDLHANFIVAEQGCTSADVSRLIDILRQRVFETFGIRLELEIEPWPYRQSENAPLAHRPCA